MENLLNDDCWLYILQFMGLKEQLALREVSPNLQGCVTKHWKSLKMAQIEGLVLDKFLVNTTLMLEFVSTTCGSLQMLMINGDVMDLLNSWRMFSFPNLHTLDCNWKPERLSVHPIVEDALIDQWLISLRWQQADEISMLLTDLFPNLRKLTLRGNARGCHLWRLSQLEELDICNPPTSDTNQFLSRILIIPELHLFHLHAPLQSLITFATQNPHKVKSIRFIYLRAPLRLFNMHNLLTLAIHRCLFDDWILNEICSEIISLEQIHLTSLAECQFPKMEDLWKMVAHFENLKVLNLYGSCFDVQKFVEARDNGLENALRQRRFPLRIHVDPKTDSLKMLQAFTHPMLKIVFEPIELVRKKVICTQYMEIEFING